MTSQLQTLKQIEAAMAATIKNATRADVCVTFSAGDRITVSGDDAAVIAARKVMRAAGCKLVETDSDEELPGELFDYYTR
jgi:hypothetical protein